MRRPKPQLTQSAMADQALLEADSVVPRSSAKRVVPLAKLIAPAIVTEIG